MGYNLLRGIAHQETVDNVQKILRKGEASADLEFGEGITNYSNTSAKFSGVIPFVKHIAALHKTDEDRIYVLDGGMQANTIIFNAVGNKKPILVDELLYDRCLETLVFLGFKVIGVPLDEKGTDSAALESLIKKYNPAAFWTNAVRYNNPTGLRTDMEHVYHIAEVCGKYGVLLHIDDAYQNCGLGIENSSAEGPFDLSHPSMKKAVIMRSTTKELTPDQKISWIACGTEADIAKKIINFATASRLNSHYRIQAAVYMAMINGDYDKHIKWVNNEYYRPRSASLNDALDKFFKGFIYNKILDASFFTTLWLKDADIDKGDKIVKTAAEMGALVTSGISSIAPLDMDSQPEMNVVSGWEVSISQKSKHSVYMLEKMNGYPVRLAPNACPNLDDPFEAVKILRNAYDKVMSA